MRFCALQPCSRISVEHKDEGALTGLRRVQGISPSLDISSSRIGISTRPLTMSVPSKPYFHNPPPSPIWKAFCGRTARSALIAARSAASTMTLPRPALALASARIAASNWDRFCVGAYPAPPSSTGGLSHVRQQESRERTAGAPHPRRHVQERMVPFAIASAKRCATAHSLLWAVRVRLSRRSLAASRALRPVRAGSP